MNYHHSSDDCDQVLIPVLIISLMTVIHPLYAMQNDNSHLHNYLFDTQKTTITC
jgi:hypothetical protein